MSAIARLAGSLMLLLLLAAASAANGQNKVPAARPLEALVKSSLLTFNDANVTGNYTVLHARISKPFAQKFPPDKLKEAFKDFNEKSIDIDVVSAMTPVYDEPPLVDPDGKLLLKGHFATEPTRVKFELDFIPSDGEWKLIRLHVVLGAAP
jgi:hypothetical protein